MNAWCINCPSHLPLAQRGMWACIISVIMLLLCVTLQGSRVVTTPTLSCFWFSWLLPFPQALQIQTWGWDGLIKFWWKAKCAICSRASKASASLLQRQSKTGRRTHTRERQTTCSPGGPDGPVSCLFVYRWQSDANEAVQVSLNLFGDSYLQQRKHIYGNGLLCCTRTVTTCLTPMLKRVINRPYFHILTRMLQTQSLGYIAVCWSEFEGMNDSPHKRCRPKTDVPTNAHESEFLNINTHFFSFFFLPFFYAFTSSSLIQGNL